PGGRNALEAPATATRSDPAPPLRQLDVREHGRPSLALAVAGEAGIRARVQVWNPLSDVVAVPAWYERHREAVRADAGHLRPEEERHEHRPLLERLELPRQAA